MIPQVISALAIPMAGASAGRYFGPPRSPGANYRDPITFRLRASGETAPPAIGDFPKDGDEILQSGLESATRPHTLVPAGATREWRVGQSRLETFFTRVFK